MVVLVALVLFVLLGHRSTVGELPSVLCVRVNVPSRGLAAESVCNSRNLFWAIWDPPIIVSPIIFNFFLVAMVVHERLGTPLQYSRPSWVCMTRCCSACWET